MREMESMLEKLSELKDERLRCEILAAQRVLLNTFDAMLKEARSAQKYRRQMVMHLDDAEKAAGMLTGNPGELDSSLSDRKALIAYIIRFGREAILPDASRKSAPIGRTLYAASNAAGFSGVYSSAEKARDAGFDEELRVLPLIPAYEDASSGRCVCMAEGEWTSLCIKDGQCTTETCSTGPVWGCSVQACLSAFNRLGLQGVALKSLYIYEIDRMYPCLVNAADRMNDLFSTHAGQQVHLPEVMARDYIQQYFDEIRCEAEYIEKYYSEDTLRILKLIGEKYGLNTKQKVWMRIELCRRFSKEELMMEEDVLKRVEEWMPRRRSGGRREKQLKYYLE